MKKNFLAGLTPAAFLRRHWQKKPLLARNALGTHAGAVTRDALFRLAAREDVESRVIMRTGGRWAVRQGPFSPRELRRMPSTRWTLLVNGVDLEIPAAAALLQEFSFIPHARLDDVMVSYAAPGGGVGPHFDSYDVFLVQGAGERRWRVSAQADLDLDPRAPLKILRRFKAEREWTLGAGDVLYLPPGYAHDGVAIGECITYSIGFRAPRAEELAPRFLEFLQDRIAVEGGYADPGLKPTASPGRVPEAMVSHSARVLARVRWSERDVAEFLGRYLSEPREHVVFERPPRPLTAAAFARRAAREGIMLAPASRMLYRGSRVFINGESVPATRTLRKLADARALAPPLALTPSLASLLYAWYRDGYIRLPA